MLSLSAGLQLTHDSNVPRASSSQSALAQNAGDGKLGDTYLKGLVGLNFDRQISQQRIQANAQIDGYKYNNYSDFDNIGYRAGLNYDWVIGRPFYGQIGADVRRYQPQIQDGQITDGKRNRIDSQFLYFKGGVRITPSLSIIGTVDYERRRNSLLRYQTMDVNVDGLEGGLRWAPGTGLELDFVYRRSKGDYANLMTVLPSGVPAFAPYSNNYKQNEVLLRASYRPSEDTRLGGFIGQTKRDFDVNDPETGVDRNFNGVTAGGDLEWALTGLTKMRVRFGRTIAPQDAVYTYSYVVADYIDVRPRIMLTGRIAVEPYLNYMSYKYSGDRNAGTQTRKDDLAVLGVQGTYELTRTVNLLGELRHERRNSNFDQWDFKANIISIGVLAKF